MQAGGLAAPTLNGLFRYASGSRGSTRRAPIALRLQWVDATRLLGFATNRHE